MSKKFCKDKKKLRKKTKKSTPRYTCKKCDANSPKEKWLCKPRSLP